MTEIRFGNEMNIRSRNREPIDYHYRNATDPEIRVSEVNRAIDCWLLTREPISFVFPTYANPDCVDRVFHPVFNRYGFDWIKCLTISHNADLDSFCESIGSYFKFILQENLAKQTK